jgi:hypothetical protein
MADVARALSLFDDAQEILEQLAFTDPDWEAQLADYKTKALALLQTERAHAYIELLKEQASSDLGWYCQARLMIKDAKDLGTVRDALAILNDADQKGIRLQARTLVLRISLMRRLPETRLAYSELLISYERLEATIGFQLRPVDRFYQAVLYYQVGRYAEGKESFRRLREYLRRSGDFPPRLRDYLRRKDEPQTFQRVQMRVIEVLSEWRASGYVDELRQTVPFRPRHFIPAPKESEVITALIRFELNGPIAVPERFEENRRP